jgi:hypothetical protein
MKKTILNEIKAEYNKKNSPLQSINTGLRGEREKYKSTFLQTSQLYFRF